MNLDVYRIAAPKPDSVFYFTKYAKIIARKKFKLKIPHISHNLLKLEIYGATKILLKRFISIAPNLR